MNKKPLAVLIDLDGVICNVPHNPLEFTWDRFQRADREVGEHLHVGTYLSKMFEIGGLVVLFLTARPEFMREQTQEMLDNSPVGSLGGLLFMSPNADADKQVCENYREVQAIQKGRMTSILQKEYNIILAIDDQQENCEVFNSFGIPTLTAKFV